MTGEKLEADKRRDPVRFLINTLGKRIQPLLLRYWGSRLAMEFERSWMEATEARLAQNLAAPPGTDESIWALCETTLFQALESMEVPKHEIAQEQADDILALMVTELERLEEEDAIGEQMAWLFGQPPSVATG